MQARGLRRTSSDLGLVHGDLYAQYKVYPEQQILFNGYYIFERQPSLEENYINQIEETDGALPSQTYLMTLNNNNTKSIYAGQGKNTIASFAS